VELFRLRGDQRLPFFFGIAEPELRLIARQGTEHDPPDPELDAVADERLVGARQ
jgi:hypothetical protein